MHYEVYGFKDKYVLPLRFPNSLEQHSGLVHLPAPASDPSYLNSLGWEQITKQHCTNLPSCSPEEVPKSLFQNVSFYLTLCLSTVWLVKCWDL